MKKVLLVAAVSVFALASCRSGSHAKRPHCEAYGGSAPVATKKVDTHKSKLQIAPRKEQTK